MTSTYKCRLCKILFAGPCEKPVCPRCGSKYTERLLRRGNKKIKKKKKFAGNFVEVGEKCRKCDFSEKLTSPNIKLKCNCPEPEVAFRQGKWLCYSSKIADNCKKMELDKK